MITVQNLTLAFGKRTLFKDVNVKFTPGNCYGLIGANGAGKSTFLKILTGEIEANKGEVLIDKNLRVATLKQDQFAFDDFTVLDTVIKGHEQLYEVMKKREELYSKSEMTEEEGELAANMEMEFAEMNGYEAEAEAGALLGGLGINEDEHHTLMGDLEAGLKVRVLLAQAIFGNPDILLLDEPTNNLDIQSIDWLENFLYKFENTVIVVSHDRHFLNKVCTHIADIDYGTIKLYVGNYNFWYQASTLAIRQMKDQNKKKEDKIKELQEFVQRFSANASKARQATSRKKLIEKLTFDEMPRTSRRFPFIHFKPERECGDIILEVSGLTKYIDGEVMFEDFNLSVAKKDKIVFIGKNDNAKSAFFEIISENMKPDHGEFNWGQTITTAYIPRENTDFFLTDINLVDWLRQFSKEKDETYIRGFLGRMLFSGEESQKSANVLSGGEKVRCMLSRMMLQGANALILDEPTNHLDLEAITSLNTAMETFPEVLLFSSHDHQLVSSVANRVIEFTPNGIIDKYLPFDEYLANDEIKALRRELYAGETALML
jgi:ATPase subunit of ABC transporter with duplicated ATPase domains